MNDAPLLREASAEVRLAATVVRTNSRKFWRISKFKLFVGFHITRSHV